jgi:hypothetical protein
MFGSNILLNIGAKRREAGRRALIASCHVFVGSCVVITVDDRS